MVKTILFLILFIGIVNAQFDYSLEDKHPSSQSYGHEVGPSFFEDHVTLNYFGHFY